MCYANTIQTCWYVHKHNNNSGLMHQNSPEPSLSFALRGSTDDPDLRQSDVNISKSEEFYKRLPLPF